MTVDESGLEVRTVVDGIDGVPEVQITVPDGFGRLRVRIMDDLGGDIIYDGNIDTGDTPYARTWGLPTADDEPEETTWKWGTRADVLRFIETLEPDALLQIDYLHPAMFTGDSINPSDDLCRYRRQAGFLGSEMPYPRRFMMSLYRTRCDIENLPVTETND